MNKVTESPRKVIQFVHCYLVVNIYTLQVTTYGDLALARDKRNVLNKHHVHPAHYPKDAKDPYILVLVKSGEVVE